MALLQILGHDGEIVAFLDALGDREVQVSAMSVDGEARVHVYIDNACSALLPVGLTVRMAETPALPAEVTETVVVNVSDAESERQMAGLRNAH